MKIDDLWLTLELFSLVGPNFSLEMAVGMTKGRGVRSAGVIFASVTRVIVKCVHLGHTTIPCAPPPKKEDSGTNPEWETQLRRWVPLQQE